MFLNFLAKRFSILINILDIPSINIYLLHTKIYILNIFIQSRYIQCKNEYIWPFNLKNVCLLKGLLQKHPVGFNEIYSIYDFSFYK